VGGTAGVGEREGDGGIVVGSQDGETAAKHWGWGGGIRAYVPKTAGTDASQLSQPPTPMTGHPAGAPGTRQEAGGNAGRAGHQGRIVRKGGAAEGLGLVSGKRYVNMSEDETETGWGSDVSSGDEPQVVVDPYDEDPFAHVFSSEVPQPEVAASHSPQKEGGEGAGSAARQNADAGVAAGFEAEAARLELEAAALKEAARIAEEQRKLREAAQEEAERAKEEVELLRKQIAAMDDRMKASAKLEQRQKMAAVEAVISDLIGAAVDTVEAWWVAAAAAEDRPQDEAAEEEDVVMDDEGDGNDELLKWQKIRERELAQNRKRRVIFDVAPGDESGEATHTVAAAGSGVSFQVQNAAAAGGNRPVMTAEEHARYLESELRAAEEAGEELAGAGGRSAPRKPVVQFVNPGDISSSDEEEDGGGEDTEEEEDVGGDDIWASMDPELLLKLQTLSCVLIQRAYRHYRARRAPTPFASEVSWPVSARGESELAYELLAQAPASTEDAADGGSCGGVGGGAGGGEGGGTAMLEGGDSALEARELDALAGLSGDSDNEEGSSRAQSWAASAAPGGVSAAHKGSPHDSAGDQGGEANDVHGPECARAGGCGEEMGGEGHHVATQGVGSGEQLQPVSGGEEGGAAAALSKRVAEAPCARGDGDGGVVEEIGGAAGGGKVRGGGKLQPAAQVGFIARAGVKVQ